MRYIDKLLIKDLESIWSCSLVHDSVARLPFLKWLISQYHAGEYLNWDQIKDRKIQKQDWNESAPIVVLMKFTKTKMEELLKRDL